SLTTLGVAIVALVAWNAPEPRAAAAAPRAAVTAPATASAAPVASYAPVVDRVMPAVVTVRVEKRASAVPTSGQVPDDDLLRRFFGPQMRIPRQPRGIERGLGSGVIVSQDGYILTNNHVVDGADEVKVELPDRHSYTAKVVGTDAPSDLAVIKINANDLPTLPLGDSDVVKVGDVVLAVGNIGLGFAIPSNMAKSVMEQLIKNGTVHRAKLGVTIQRITPDLAQSLGLASANGALVSNVESGSPADRAGLRQGDVITQFNG